MHCIGAGSAPKFPNPKNDDALTRAQNRFLLTSTISSVGLGVINYKDNVMNIGIEINLRLSV